METKYSTLLFETVINGEAKVQQTECEQRHFGVSAELFPAEF
jgi:hypothetical protein